MSRSKHLIKSILREYKNVASDLKKPNINDAEEHILELLKTKGVAVVPGFYDSETCDSLAEITQELLSAHEGKVRVSSNGADQRLFGANRASEKIHSFYSDSFILNQLMTYEKATQVEGFTLAAKISASEDNLGSGNGWHRDRISSRQTKGIVYLTDVGEENGPFEFVEGSHKSSSIIWDHFKENWESDKYRFTDEEIAGFLKANKDAYKTFVAKKGTLILVDTRGIHRGKPLKEGERIALTNYYWFDEPIPKRMEDLCIR